MSERQEWLDSLQVGDEVVVSSSYRTYIAKIDRITPTRRFKIGNVTFKPTGTETGQSWSLRSIWEATPERREEINRGCMIGKLTNVKWHTCTTDQLKAIINILEVTGDE